MTCAEPAVHQFDQRLRSLERQVRFFRTSVTSLLVLGAALMLGGSGRAGGDVLEARGLLLRGPDGVLRGSFVVSDDGGVRLTLIDDGQRAKAGLWMDPDGYCEAWGFDNLERPAPSGLELQITGAGKLIALDSDTRIIERRHDKWMVGYRLSLRNETGQAVDQPFFANLVDDEGYVLGRQARLVKLAPGETVTLNGEIGLSPERAEQVAQVMLAVFDR